ncbi:DMT family transporter [Sporofaciens musculi]|uniref:DMT family transporter n=1 Tax=Sporofaciens musculi TaxID=2681861 RepID=UPI00258367C4|nr:DMT family transporter [Sporofaciens musculi]
MNNRTKGMALAIITAVMWGIMGVFVRTLSQYQFTNLEISFFRCALAGVAYFLFLIFTNPSALKIDLKGIFICLAYGAAAYSISFVSYSVAVSRIPVGVATVLMFMSPIWVAILGRFMFREKLKKSKIITIFVCLIGAVLVADLVGSGNMRLDGLGILAGVINGVGVALQILLPKFFAKDYERDTLLVYGFLGAALVLLFGIDFSALSVHMSSTPVLSLLWNLFGIGILCTMVANVACVKSTQYVEATTTSILSALEVVVGTLVGFVIFHEHMTLLQMLGAVIIVVGAIGSEIYRPKSE